jgi:hypothetical protein
LIEKGKGNALDAADGLGLDPHYGTPTADFKQADHLSLKYKTPDAVHRALGETGVNLFQD